MKIPGALHTTLALIDQAITKRAEMRESRNYMGLSGIGEECDRKLWYSFHQPVKILDPRVNRIFDTGNAFEALVIKWLKEAGFEVLTDENGQYGGEDEMLAWHIDGVIRGLPESDKWHLLEIKSAKNDSFKKFVKDGLKKTNINYYVQCLTYMEKESLERALFIVVNKDTQELYTERIKSNKMEALFYINRAKEIARMESEPERKYKSSSFYLCKFCPHSDKCWTQTIQ